MLSAIAGASLTALASGVGTYALIGHKGSVGAMVNIGVMLLGGVGGWFIRFGGLCGGLVGLSVPWITYLQCTDPNTRKQNSEAHAFPLIAMFVVSVAVSTIVGYKLDRIYL